MGDGHITRDLRAIREDRGWSRETLAHHAGISCAAIAQIEAGRRPDPRLSTVIALADALGVGLDEIVGRDAPAGATSHRLKHCALLYGTETEFLEATVPFLSAGLEQSHAVLAVTARARIRRLRRALGGDATRVVFREASGWYSSPQAALDSYRAFLHESANAGTARVRILGEPVWDRCSAREIRGWTRYESMLNVSLAASPATIMCAYDSSSLAARILGDAQCTHPQVVIGTSASASPSFRSPEAFLLER